MDQKILSAVAAQVVGCQKNQRQYRALNVFLELRRSKQVNRNVKTAAPDIIVVQKMLSVVTAQVVGCQKNPRQYRALNVFLEPRRPTQVNRHATTVAPDCIVVQKMLCVVPVQVVGCPLNQRLLPVRNVRKGCTVIQLIKENANNVVSITFPIAQVNNLARTAVQESTLLKRVKHRAKSVELASMVSEMAVKTVRVGGIAQI